MEWNYITVIILVVVLLIGYGIGLLESHLRNSGKIKRVEQKMAALQVTKDVGNVMPARESGALRIWVDPAQTLSLELDGNNVESPQSITPEQRRRLVTLITKIRPWVEGGPIAPASSLEERPIRQPSAAQTIPPATSGEVAAPETTSTLGAKSIVLQIDDVLQKLLAGTALASKRILLRETPGGGVLVHVGSEQYEGIDAVPDAEIQAIIRRAAAEWEKGSK
jgi:hypothetical protein